MCCFIQGSKYKLESYAKLPRFLNYPPQRKNRSILESFGYLRIYSEPKKKSTDHFSTSEKNKKLLRGQLRLCQWVFIQICFPKANLENWTVSLKELLLRRTIAWKSCGEQKKTGCIRGYGPAINWPLEKSEGMKRVSRAGRLTGNRGRTWKSGAVWKKWQIQKYQMLCPNKDKLQRYNSVLVSWSIKEMPTWSSQNCLRQKTRLSAKALIPKSPNFTFYQSLLRQIGMLVSHVYINSGRKEFIPLRDKILNIY